MDFIWLITATGSGSGPSDLRVAAIGAAAAVGGALVGGLVTGFVTLRAEEKRQDFQSKINSQAADRERDQEQAIARGAARAIRSQFLRSRITLDAAARMGHWWPLSEQEEIDMPLDDRKLVASRLSAPAWTMVEFAETTYANLLSQRGTHEMRGDDLLPEISADERLLIENVYRRLQQAVHSLKPLTEMEDPPIEPLPTKHEEEP